MTRIDDALDADALARTLGDRFGGTDGERRVVVRQATDLADAGAHERDRGVPLTEAEIVSNLADAPADSSLVDRWNWWMGALEAAYGGYEQFQVRRYRRE